MSDCRVSFGPGDQVELWVGSQHISRLRHREVRDLFIQVLIFGGKELRDDVFSWLSSGKMEQIAEVIAPEPKKA